MSINYNMIEKITIRNSSELQPEVIEHIAKEIDRIKAFKESNCTLLVNAGNEWEEYSGRRCSARSLVSAIRKHQDLSIFIRCGYCWRPSCCDMEDPGLSIAKYLDNCDDSVFNNLAFELFNYADCGESCGSLIQFGKREDGTVYRGAAEYEEISEIPDAVWLNEPITVYVYAGDLPSGCDPDAVNAAVRRMNATEYHPKDDPGDFHYADAEAFINQPKLETAAQRAEFFAALEEARIATKGGLIMDRPEFVDTSSVNVRKLMIDMDAATGAVRFYMTRPLR